MNSRPPPLKKKNNLGMAGLLMADATLTLCVLELETHILQPEECAG